MPSDEDFQRLQEIVQALTIQVNAANNKIRDLEAGMQDHIGLSWGSSLVDFNAPHPDISVTTIESGGGLIRQDVNGMQVKAPNVDNTVIWFVKEFFGDTDPVNYGALYGNVFDTISQVTLGATADDGGGTVGSVGLTLTADNTGTGEQGVRLHVGTDAGEAGSAWLFFDPQDDVSRFALGLGAGLSPTVLRINALPSDQTSPQDGDIWYYNNKLYARINGATVELGGGGVSIVNSDNWAEGVGEEFWYDVTGSTMGGWSSSGTTTVQSGGTGDWLSSSDMDEAYIEIDASGGHEYLISPLRFGGAMWNRMIELLRGSAPTKLCVEFTAAFPGAAGNYLDYEGVGFWSDNSAPASTAAVAVITKNGVGNWQLYSGVGATATDTGSAVDTNPHRFRIEVGTSTIEWFVDGTSQGTITRPNDCWPVGFGMSTGNGNSGDIRLHGHGRVYAA